MPLFAGGNIFAVSLSVNDLRLVSLGVDLNLEVMRRCFVRRHGDDLDRLARREHSIHPGGADADSLLATAHPQAVEFGSVQELAENQRDLFLDDFGTVVLQADLETIGAGGSRCFDAIDSR